MSRSAKETPAASTRTRTWPRLGSGASSSTVSKNSGPPKRRTRTRTDFITASPKLDLERDASTTSRAERVQCVAPASGRALNNQQYTGRAAEKLIVRECQGLAE